MVLTSVSLGASIRYYSVRKHHKCVVQAGCLLGPMLTVTFCEDRDEADNCNSNLPETTCHSDRELLCGTETVLKKYGTRPVESCHRVPSQCHLCSKKNRTAVNLWLTTSYVRNSSSSTSKLLGLFFDFRKAGSRSGQIHLWHKPIYFTRFRLDMKLVPTRTLNDD